MDIIDLEYPVGPESTDEFRKLRSDMIFQRTDKSEYRIQTKFEYDDMRRVRIVNNTYYHQPIKDKKGNVKTSYTLGIALPEDYGLYKLIPKTFNLRDSANRIRDAMDGKESGTNFTIANWELCYKGRDADPTRYLRVSIE